MVITQGYFGNNSVQGRRVRATAMIAPDGIKVALDCPHHGRQAFTYEGGGAARASHLRQQILAQHADCTKLTA